MLKHPLSRFNGLREKRLKPFLKAWHRCPTPCWSKVWMRRLCARSKSDA